MGIMPESQLPSAEELLQVGFQYAYALTHHHHDAEDLVQTAWLKLYQRYGEVKTKALFFTTIRNTYVDQYRRRKRIPFATLSSEHEDFPAPGDVGQKAVESTLDWMLAQLRDVEREALFLHVVEGYSANEIAVLTGKPRGTVLSLIHRGRQKLTTLAEAETRSS